MPTAAPVSTATRTGSATHTWSVRAWVWLVGLALLAGSVRLARLGWWSLSPDEAANWLQAMRIELAGGDASAATVSGGVLRFLLTTGLLPAQSEGWLRLPFALLGTATVVLLALALARSLGSRAALLAAAALALHPGHVRWSQTADDGALLAFAAVLALVVSMFLRKRLAGLADVPAALVVLWGCATRDTEPLLLAVGPLVLGFAACGLLPIVGLPAAARRSLGTAPTVAVGLGLGLELWRGVPSGLAAAALPGALALAAAAAAQLGPRLYAQCAAWQPLALPWTLATVAAAPAAWLLTALAVGSVLLLTVRNGERADARAVAQYLLQQAAAAKIVVAAGEHRATMHYYLQPSGRAKSVAVVAAGTASAATGTRFAVTAAGEEPTDGDLAWPELVRVFGGNGEWRGLELSIWRDATR